MSIFQRLRNRFKRFTSGLGRSTEDAPPRAHEERMNFSAEIPGVGDKPLWRVQLQMFSEPQAEGERLRLRAHIETNLASALRPALEGQKSPTATASDSKALTRSENVVAHVQSAAGRALQVPLIRSLAEPLLKHDLNTWVEINASTAPLEQGARDLMPQRDQLASMGIAPRNKEGPVMESWAGESPAGFAQVSLLQMEKKDLPGRLQRLMGSKPFQFAAAIVNTIEAKPKKD